VGSVTLGLGQKVASDKFYRIVDGKVGERTYNGFRRYNAGCNHCHGPDGVGSTPNLLNLRTARKSLTGLRSARMPSTP
jgi:mono/diheme cytochrome c family protein